MSNQVIIGLTVDFADDQKYSKSPYFALRKNYTDILIDNGASVILLPPFISNIENYLELIDGVIVTGGDFDIDPKLYGSSTLHPSTKVNSQRSQFEFELTKLAINKKMPIFGICGGMQLINVIYGGNLIQHIPENKSFLEHEVKPYNKIAHKVIIKNETILFDIIQKQKIGVNSSHHQAVDKLGKNLIASAHTEDGIIEAIENPHYENFMLGVQWHPEYQISIADNAIFHRFIDICYKFKITK